MITSKKKYLEYLQLDKEALGISGIKDYLFHDIWHFQKALRKAEYWHNCSTGKVSKLISFYYRHVLRKKGRKLGFSIPVNTFGPGLSIAHAGTIVINSHSRIGANCRIHVCVNIGASAGNSEEAPTIGDDCYIGPGVKVYGAILIGDNTGIGANAVVNRSFPEESQTIAGIPALKISARGPLQFRNVSVQGTLKKQIVKNL
ncbi:MAG: serine acetyltransferase [Colwellia sp.]|nr:serine acetyltransferase [Colwellia sp.]